MNPDTAGQARISDPAMFGELTPSELDILRYHLTSGWYKQSAVYPTLSEPWWETSWLLKDVHEAHQAHFPQDGGEAA